MNKWICFQTIMAEKCFHSTCTSIISFCVNPWLITLGSKIANIQLSTGLPFKVIKNSSSLKIMAIINQVEGYMDQSPVAESAGHHGKVSSRQEEEHPDHGQKCATCDTAPEEHSRRGRDWRLPQPQKSPPQFSLKLHTRGENVSLWKLDFSFKRWTR